MSDPAYENASRRREELAEEIHDTQQRIEALRAELRGVDTFLEQWKKFAGIPVPPVDPAEAGAAVVSYLHRHMRRNSKKEEVAEAARKILLDEGQPLSRADLYKRLVGIGLTIEGSDPEMVLSTMLWRMKDKIVRLSSGGYWVNGIPHRDSAYAAHKDIDDLLESVDHGDSGVDPVLSD